MTEFKVELDWLGWVPKSPWYFYITGYHGWKRQKFLDSDYVFDLIVTPTKVELAGPGTSLITNPSLLVKTSLNNVWWFSMMEIHDRFDAKVEGWRVQEISCADDDNDESTTGAGSEESEGNSETGTEEGVVLFFPEKATGVVVRFKAIIDAGTISTTIAAPVAEITVKGQKIKIPIGASTTKASGSKHYEVTGTFKLCPDGSGGYTVEHLVESRKNGEIIGIEEIKSYWSHKNH